jgi:hypothetical protein
VAASGQRSDPDVAVLDAELVAGVELEGEVAREPDLATPVGLVIQDALSVVVGDDDTIHDRLDVGSTADQADFVPAVSKPAKVVATIVGLMVRPGYQTIEERRLSAA